MANTAQHRKGGQFKKAGESLMRVREGRTLHWPRRSIRGGPQARGGPGYVVWADDPLLNTEKLDNDFCLRHGLNPADCQLHKLELAPAGAQVSGHQNKGAQEVYAELHYSKIPYGYIDPSEGFVATSSRPSPMSQSTDVEVPAVDGE